MKNKTIKKDCKVWFFDNYDNLCEGIVKNINTLVVKGELTTYATIKGTGDTIGTMGAKVADCFLTQTGCLNAKAKKDRAFIDAYKTQINSTEDLIKFMYNEPVARCGEYTDWNARKAAAEWALEHLNIKL